MRIIDPTRAARHRAGVAGSDLLPAQGAVHRKPADKAQTDPPSRPAQGMGSERGVSFAFFFTGGSFGTAAQGYVAAYYPSHIRHEARSFEEVFRFLSVEVPKMQAAAGDRPVHVDEIILVSHANAAGGMKIALTDEKPADKFSPAHVAALQQRAIKGGEKKFMKTRAKALGGIDAQTRIVVRGCELGKGSSEPLDALALLFGGRPVVMAPRAFQGFSLEPIGPLHRLKTPEQAFDWLVGAGYIQPFAADITPADKRTYMRTHFRSGVPSEFFLVGEEDYKHFKEMSQRDKLGEKSEKSENNPDGVKTRDEDPTNIYEGRATGAPNAHWAVEHRAGSHDTELALPRAELVARAEALVRTYKPTDAAMLLRLWEAWQFNETENKGTRVDQDERHNVVGKRPEVFDEETIWRAKRDLVTRPDARQDQFLQNPAKYGETTAGADDFTHSESVTGLVDPAVAPQPGGQAKKARNLPFDAASTFVIGFGDVTGQGAFGRGELPETHTGDAELDAAMAAVRFVVLMLRAGLTLAELKDTQRQWESVGQVIDRVLVWAGKNGFPTKDIIAGRSRVAQRINAYEATLRSRKSEEKVKLPHPEAGLYDEEAKALGVQLQKNAELLTKLKDWDVRYGVRAASVALAVADLETEVRGANAVRTAIGLWAVWGEYQTLEERFEAARQKGLIPASATIAKFTAHVGSVVSESVSLTVRGLTALASLQANAFKAAGAVELAEVWAGRVSTLKNIGTWLGKWVAGGAGVLQIVAGALDFVSAWESGDQRAERAAIHSIAQGSVSLAGAAFGVEAGTTVAVSGSLIIIWATIEAIAMAADNIKGFEKLQKLDRVRAMLHNAGGLVPWGKRMAGVSDAWTALEAEDPARATELQDDFLARAREPYAIVLKGLLGISTAIRDPELPLTLTGEEHSAIARLEPYEYRDAVEFSPGDMQEISEIAVVLFGALRRSGSDAIKTYGPPLREK